MTGCSRQVDGTTRYLLDGLSVVAQYDTGGQRQAWYTQSLARIDEVLNVVNEGGKQWYQADALGSVYGLTSASGALLATTNYDVFGALVPAPSGPAGQPFGFTGREHELDSGLVYARARYLNPAIGRWTRSDPAGFADGTNRYVYVRGRPTVLMDPSGRFSAGLHNVIASEAAKGQLTPSEIASVMAASADADSWANSVPELSFRHGMSAPGQPMDVAIRDWADFAISRMAVAIDEWDCNRSDALLALGHGFHAVTDAEVRVHRFTTWNPWNLLAVAAHVAYEFDLRRDDADVQAAITAARYFFDAFAAARRSPKRFGAKWYAYTYYGWQLPIQAAWLVTQ